MSYGFNIQLFDGVTRPAHHMADAMGDLKRTGMALKNQLESITPSVKKVGNAFSGLRNMIAVDFIVDGIRDIGSSIIGTMTKFETMEAVLTNTLGSNSAAKDYIAQIKDFAAETPFKVDELTESAIKLANRGILPSMEEMRNMGDLAAALGKPFGDLNEAMLDVSNTERWTEIGIKVSKEGNKMKGTFKGVTMEVAATEQGALEMVKAFGQMEGVAGTMDGIAGTLGGMLNKLKADFVGLAITVGDVIRPALVDGME